MRVKLQLVICNDEGQEETVTDVIALNKDQQRIEHLGLTLTESKHLLSTIQRHLLQQQVTTFLAARSTSFGQIIQTYLFVSSYTPLHAHSSSCIPLCHASY